MANPELKNTQNYSNINLFSIVEILISSYRSFVISVVIIFLVIFSTFYYFTPKKNYNVSVNVESSHIISYRPLSIINSEINKITGVSENEATKFGNFYTQENIGLMYMETITQPSFLELTTEEFNILNNTNISEEELLNLKEIINYIEVNRNTYGNGREKKFLNSYNVQLNYFEPGKDIYWLELIVQHGINSVKKRILNDIIFLIKNRKDQVISSNQNLIDYVETFTKERFIYLEEQLEIAKELNYIEPQNKSWSNPMIEENKIEYIGQDSNGSGIKFLNLSYYHGSNLLIAEIAATKSRSNQFLLTNLTVLENHLSQIANLESSAAFNKINTMNFNILNYNPANIDIVHANKIYSVKIISLIAILSSVVITIILIVFYNLYKLNNANRRIFNK